MPARTSEITSSRMFLGVAMMELWRGQGRRSAWNRHISNKAGTAEGVGVVDEARALWQGASHPADCASQLACEPNILAELVRVAAAAIRALRGCHREREIVLEIAKAITWEDHDGVRWGCGE